MLLGVPVGDPAQRGARRRARDGERRWSARSCCCPRCSPGSAPNVNRGVARPRARSGRREPVLEPRRRAVDAPPGRSPRSAARRSCSLAASPVLRMRSVLPDARIFPLDSEVRRVDEALGDAGALRSGRRLGDAGDRRDRRVPPLDAREPEAAARLRGAAGRGRRASPRCASPFDELDPDTQTPEELARDRRGRPHRDAPRAHDPAATARCSSRPGAHAWRSAQAAEVLEAVRAVPHPASR